MNIKNNFGPQTAPILAPSGVLSGTRQQHVLTAVFLGTSAPDMECTAFLSPKGISIGPLKTGYNFIPQGAVIFVSGDLPGHADQLL